jgi:hypothetical protein
MATPPHGIGQSARHVERLGTPAIVLPIETDRRRRHQATEPLESLNRSANGRCGVGDALRTGCLPAEPECRYLRHQRAASGKSQAVGAARRDQGGWR